jgi:thymidylate kinase
VRKGYLDIAKREPRRVKVIDTREGEDRVFDKIREIVDNLIKKQGKRSIIFKSQITNSK